MEFWLIWLIATGVLLIAELLTTTVWFLCMAIGTLCAVVCAVAGGGIVAQVITMFVGTIAALIFVLPHLKKVIAARNDHEAATNADALIGRKALVTHDITPKNTGRVKLDGDSWQARATDSTTTFTAGTTVTVRAIDSIILIVE